MQSHRLWNLIQNKWRQGASGDGCFPAVYEPATHAGDRNPVCFEKSHVLVPGQSSFSRHVLFCFVLLWTYDTISMSRSYRKSHAIELTLFMWFMPYRKCYQTRSCNHWQCISLISEGETPINCNFSLYLNICVSQTWSQVSAMVYVLKIIHSLRLTRVGILERSIGPWRHIRRPGLQQQKREERTQPASWCWGWCLCTNRL